MRVFAVFSVLLALAPCSAATERVQGFLTFGCDSYLRPLSVAETWHVDLTESLRRDVLRMANYHKDDRYFSWTTLYVDVDGVIESSPREGFLTRHTKHLSISRLRAARYLEPGESVDAAVSAATQYEGFFLAGPESVGLVPFKQKDEMWWVVAGKTSWDEILERFQPIPDLENKRFYDAVVVVTGRVGPPGEYGHTNIFNREISIDSFRYLRAATPEEMTGTAAVYDADVPGSGVPAINRCGSPLPKQKP
jgi:hypothetical protein